MSHLLSSLVDITVPAFARRGRGYFKSSFWLLTIRHCVCTDSLYMHCGSQKLTVSIFLYHAPSHFPRRPFSELEELTILPRLAGQQAHRKPPTSVLGLQLCAIVLGFYMELRIQTQVFTLQSLCHCCPDLSHSWTLWVIF